MRRPPILIALGLLVGLVVGFVGGRFTPGRADAPNNTAAFAQAVGQAGISTLTLKWLREGELDKMDRLHAALLRGSLESANHLRTASLVPEVPLPELVEAAKRTADFCAADPELAELASMAAQVRDRMQELSESAL